MYLVNACAMTTDTLTAQVLTHPLTSRSADVEEARRVKIRGLGITERVCICICKGMGGSETTLVLGLGLDWLSLDDID